MFARTTVLMLAMTASLLGATPAAFATIISTPPPAEPCELEFAIDPETGRLVLRCEQPEQPTPEPCELEFAIDPETGRLVLRCEE
jgi:hypothetical protein